MGIREDGETAVLGGTGEKAWLAVCWSLFVLVGLSGVLVGDELGERVFAVVLLAVSGVFFVRILRIHVRAEPEQLVIRGFLRTRRLSWDQVKRAVVVPTNAIGLFGIIEVTDQIGREIKADGVGNWLPMRDEEDLPVSRMAALINSRARD